MFRDMPMRSWLEKGKAEMDEGSRYPRDVPPLPSRTQPGPALRRRVRRPAASAMRIVWEMPFWLEVAERQRGLP